MFRPFVKSEHSSRRIRCCASKSPFPHSQPLKNPLSLFSTMPADTPALHPRGLVPFMALPPLLGPLQAPPFDPPAVEPPQPAPPQPAPALGGAPIQFVRAGQPTHAQIVQQVLVETRYEILFIPFSLLLRLICSQSDLES